MRAACDEQLGRLWALVELESLALLVTGGYATAAGWRPAAWLLVASIACAVAGHVSISAVAYRRTIGRPWPEVPPLGDDEDW